MKKLVLLSSLLFSTTLGLAQIKVGVKGGLNVSTFTYTEPTLSPLFISDIEVNSQAGFHLGGFINFSLSENIGIQTELLYSNQGSSGKLTDTSLGTPVGIDFNWRLNYLSIPALVKYHSPSGFTVEAGPVLDFLLKGELQRDLDVDLSGFTVEDEDVKDLYNGLDLKFALGAGYELASGLSLNLRYSFGLSNALDEDSSDFAEGEEAINNVFQLSAGFPIFAK